MEKYYYMKERFLECIGGNDSKYAPIIDKIKKDRLKLNRMADHIHKLVGHYEKALAIENDLSLALMSFCIGTLDVSQEFGINAEVHYDLNCQGSKFLSEIALLLI